MKYVVTVFLCFLSIQHTNAQSLSLFGFDASNFPEMKAKFYAYDTAGKKQSLQISDLNLTENGQPRLITYVNCPPPSPPSPLSTVLVIDISGSMKQRLGPDRNIDIAKNAAHIWVKSLAINGGECAVTSFNQYNYLNQDFTTDTTRLNEVIDYLEPGGGTNYNAALINPMAGGLVISKNGVKKRIIILLTDGDGGGDQDAIVAEANKQNCTIYCVTLGMSAPSKLIEIAARTGGMVFENVRTSTEVENVYLRILEYAQSEGPCEITWNSMIQCTSKTTLLDLNWNAVSASASYTPPATAFSSTKVQPTNMYFKNMDLLSQNDTIITITAVNDSMLVLDVIPSIKSPNFTILNANFPQMIPKNTAISFTLRFTPTDSLVKYVIYTIRTPECLYYFSATGSIHNIPNTNDSVFVPKKKFPIVKTLHLTQPNGGETFLIGSDSIISWKGISPSDTVSLDYSTDSGKVWNSIIPKTTGLLYNWKNIPAPVSKKCLVRVSQIQERDSIEIDPYFIFKHPLLVNSAAFSPDGSYAATGGDSIVRILNTITGTVFRSLIGHKDGVTAVAFTQDGTSLISSSIDSTAKVWNSSTGTELRTLRGHKGSIWDVACSSNSNIIVTGSADMTAKIWNLQSGTVLYTLQGHTGFVYGVAISKDGNRIATASGDKTIKIWDAFNGNLLQTLSGHKGYVYEVAFSPDGKLVGSVSNDNTAKIWDLNSGTIVKSLDHGSLVSDIDFSPDGKQVITASRDYYTKVWDVKTGEVVRLLGGNSSYVKSVAYSANGKRIITANNSKEATIWDEQGPLQEDVSDSVFTIVAPQPAAMDVAMGLCSVGKSKDSIVPSVVWNIGSYPFKVKSIAITGPDAAQFSMISGIPPVEIGVSDSHEVEFRFSPTSPGIKTAQLVIYTQSDTLKRRITGEGVTPVISILSKVIDFGKVLINTMKDTLQTMTIRNTSKQPITITATRHAGPNMVDYSTLSGGGSFTLLPGDTAKLDLRFYPKSLGRTSGRILFDYDGIGSPETVQLFGESVKPGAQILAAGLAIPPVICAAESTDTLRILNRGTDTLRVASATITGANYMDFQFISPFTPFSLLPDSMVLLPMRFTPNASGAKTAVLELHSNSLVDSILKVPLAGERQIVAFSTNIQKINLGTMCPNEMRDTSITLTNVGSMRATFSVQSPGIRAELIDTTLNSSGSTPITLHYPGRASEGLIDEIITITDTLCDKQTTVQVIGNIQLPRLSYPPFVDFGAVANGASSTLDIIAVNKDVRSIVISPPQGITPPFSIISLAPPVGNVLAPGDTLKVRVQYSATGALPNPQKIMWSTASPCSTLDSTELRVSGITHTLLSVATVTFDSVCVGQSRQLKAQLSNTGSTPLQLLRAEWITNMGSLFSTAISPAKILAPGTTDSLDITFTPSASGLVNADLRWVADLDTAFTTVSGIGKICATNLDTARTTIIAPNITAKAGEKVNLTLKIVKPTGMEVIGAPTEWLARIHYNKSILYNEQTSNVCTGTTDSCVLELTGVYNPKSEELISIPCITTLGNTDQSTIVIDTFYWKNSAIVTEVATQNGTITLTGVCEDGGVRLFIPANTSTSLSTRPNPAQDNLQIQYGLREPLTVTLELLTMTGRVAQTIINNQSQVAGQYTLTSDLSVLGNGVYLLRLRTNKEMLTTRVDVVK